jgi:HK97 family phage major capsid protein
MTDGAPGIMENRTLLQKADLALSDLTTDGGLLVPAQAQRFLRILINEAKVMKMATVAPMRSHKQLIEKIRFAGRVLRAGQEATALPLADRSKPDLSKVELDAKLFKAEVRLDNEVLEDSIERSQLRNTIMTIMAEAVSRDMDDVIVNGDTTSADPFFAQFDGILAQATSNVVAAGGPLTKTVLRDMMKTMPSEFLRRRQDMAFLTSTDAEIDLRDSFNARETALGDNYLDNFRRAQYSGVPVEAIPLFPENLGGGSNETNVLLLDPKNINVGVWRNIRIETDKLVSEGVLIIVATLRFDTKYAEETAVVKATGVTVS